LPLADEDGSKSSLPADDDHDQTGEGGAESHMSPPSAGSS